MSDVLGENEVEDILDKLAGRGVEVSCNCVVREGVMWECCVCVCECVGGGVERGWVGGGLNIG